MARTFLLRSAILICSFVLAITTASPLGTEHEQNPVDDLLFNVTQLNDGLRTRAAKDFYPDERKAGGAQAAYKGRRYRAPAFRHGGR